jgi:hypothetical protein
MHGLNIRLLFQGYVDLLGVHPLAQAGRGAGGAIFHDKAKSNRDKIKYNNLSNNMMISKL